MKKQKSVLAKALKNDSFRQWLKEQFELKAKYSVRHGSVDEVYDWFLDCFETGNRNLGHPDVDPIEWAPEELQFMSEHDRRIAAIATYASIKSDYSNTEASDILEDLYYKYQDKAISEYAEFDLACINDFNEYNNLDIHRTAEKLADYLIRAIPKRKRELFREIMEHALRLAQYKNIEIV